jgi:hypothetical protein
MTARVATYERRVHCIPLAQSALAQLIVLQQQRMQHSTVQSSNLLLRERLSVVEAALSARQRRLLGELSLVFPIEVVNAAAAAAADIGAALAGSGFVSGASGVRLCCMVLCAFVWCCVAESELLFTF